MITASLVAGVLALAAAAGAPPAAPAGAAAAGHGAPDGTLAQAAAELARTGGAALVLDARSGRVLAAAGPVDAPRPPGSIFKIATALAAGEAGEPALGGPLRCPSPTPAPSCAGSGHGDLLLEEALALSCNAYFGQLGQRLGTPVLRGAAARLGLGRPPGRLPEDRADPAQAGADGAGALVTARQVADLLRTVALGVLPDGDGPPPGAELLPRIRAGLRSSVLRGTSMGAAAPGEPVAIAGKTGTATLGQGTIGWFAGYGPASAPSVVLVVALRRSGREAAQAARPLFEAYFHGRPARPGGAPAGSGAAAPAASGAVAPAAPRIGGAAGGASGGHGR